MGEGAAGRPAAKMPFEDALVEVVKSLHRDPVLVYGIGAGIVLVGALALTASLALVLVVAAVLVVVLLGRIAGQVQAKRGGGLLATAFLVGGHHERVRAANFAASKPPPGPARARFRGFFMSSKDSEFGNITYGDRSDEPKDG